MLFRVAPPPDDVPEEAPAEWARIFSRILAKSEQRGGFFAASGGCDLASPPADDQYREGKTGNRRVTLRSSG
jgi:hypothetical protein